MKAHELMIGDWVRMRLSFGTQWYIDKVGVINPENELEYEPIPLTEEMLKANGFEYDDLDYEWYHDKFPALYKGENDFYKYYDGHEIHYKFVHQLQHALRLFGLNDMADNFKVK